MSEKESLGYPNGLSGRSTVTVEIDLLIRPGQEEGTKHGVRGPSSVEGGQPITEKSDRVRDALKKSVLFSDS